MKVYRVYKSDGYAGPDDTICIFEDEDDAEDLISQHNSQNSYDPLEKEEYETREKGNKLFYYKTIIISMEYYKSGKRKGEIKAGSKYVSHSEHYSETLPADVIYVRRYSQSGLTGRLVGEGMNETAIIEAMKNLEKE